MERQRPHRSLELEKVIKTGLAAVLLLCLLKMPYGYYQLVRFVNMLGFGYLAYTAAQRKDGNFVFVFLSLAILFQPFFKIALGRTVWNIVDVAVALFLILSLFRKNIGKEEKKS
ncbi:DUF6804 family protein [Kaistella soli]|uniref:DUF6804 family protein n=1 Tax=Kaistella soli TaxID=2849654 RepID=UPI0031B7F5F1